MHIEFTAFARITLDHRKFLADQLLSIDVGRGKRQLGLARLQPSGIGL